jgi:hypothetical protein
MAATAGLYPKRQRQSCIDSQLRGNGIFIVKPGNRMTEPRRGDALPRMAVSLDHMTFLRSWRNTRAPHIYKYCVPTRLLVRTILPTKTRNHDLVATRTRSQNSGSLREAERIAA